MNISDFLIVVRWQNIVITWLMQAVVYYMYLLPYCDYPSEPYPSFILLAITTGLVLAGGNIYNDLRDIHTDSFHKNKSKMIGSQVPTSRAWIWYYIFTTGGVVSCVAGWMIFDWPTSLAVIVILSTGLLILYSDYLKNTILFGNLVIALLCALAVWIPVYLIPGCIDITFQTKNPVAIILSGYILNAFLLTLLREIIKDKEDEFADHKTGIYTIGSISLPKFKGIVSALLGIITISNTIWIYFLFPVLKLVPWLLGVLFILVPICLMIYIFNLTSSDQKYARLSKLIKVFFVLAVFLLICWQLY